MKAITFTITEEEVQSYVSKKKLSNADVLLVLTFVECDHILWDKIEESIRDAILAVESKDF